MPSLTLEEIWPPFGLRVEAGDLTLSVLREGDVAALVGLVLEGIHDPDDMPFLFPWTRAPREELPANYVRYAGRVLAGQSPESTSLQLVVRRAGEVVGIQALEGEDVPVTRTMETGSWLVRRLHGQGIGTRMRQAVCALAFDHLGIERITSSAYLDNPSSMAVSRAVGYQPNGRRWIAREGEPAEQQSYVLTPGTFRRGEEIRVEGAAALREFLGLGG
ncbi:GNAT family N-acetyltransferase [Serinicoccus profundi]|uniref:GNAT family N-acetyltransferase n=1 Tax=Serinicoccus profundi TaxID=1078471 RepID=UPI000255EB97|nr:GNAT family protein [Serinicoccus profundi]